MKGKDLLADLQRESCTPDTAAAQVQPEVQPEVRPEVRPEVIAESSGSIVDLASSLQIQLSKFGRRLNDTRQRLEDTSLCYELLDKVNLLVSIN